MIYDLGQQRADIADDVFVAPTATLIGDVRMLPGSSVWFGAILRGDIEPIIIGHNSNVQDGSVCHTGRNYPCMLGDFVTVGHMATLHGCTIGDGSLIGIGATLLNGSSVGKNCIVGAHALVTAGTHFPDGVVIMGAPAKIVRDVTDDDLGDMRANAERYVARSRRYLDELQPRS